MESKVGSGGGYRLSRAPRDIRIGELVRRLDGRLSVRDSASHSPSENAHGKIATRLINDRLTKATDQVLDAMTLEELIEHVNRASSSNEMYYI